MPTLIDSLIVELSLDPSKFTPKAKEAVDDLNKLESANARRSKNNVEGVRRETEALHGLRTVAIELFAAFTGVTGLKNFIVDTVQSGAALGRFTRAVGVSAIEISKWQDVAKEFGSTGEAMASSWQGMANVFTAWTVGGPEAPDTMAKLRQIEVAAKALDSINAKTFDSTKGPGQAFKDLADNLKIIHDLSKDPNMASYLSGRLGNIDPGMFDLLITGSDNVTAALGRMRGMTQEEADAAGKLDREWNKLIATATDFGKASVLKALGSDAQDLKGAAGFIDRLFGTHLSDNFKPSEVNNSRTSIGTPAGAFTSQATKEAFIRSEAAKRGIDPDVAMKVARSEGFNAFLGDGGTSGGAFQLHVTPGGRGRAVGDEFRRQTGLDPLDRANEARGIQFALDDAKAHGWGAYHGAARVGLANNAGGAGQGGNVMITGPITVTGVKDPQDFASKLRNVGMNMRRQAEANQSSVGGE